jgi:hypothetical protein
MNTPTMAPGCLEHLESLKEFLRAPLHKSRFASFYRKLLVHRYNLLIGPDANVIEIGCGMGELLNGLHASRKNWHRPFARADRAWQRAIPRSRFALEHYRKIGWHEGHNPHPLFDVNWYLSENRDAAEAGAEPLAHYLQLGWKDGRNSKSVRFRLL